MATLLSSFRSAKVNQSLAAVARVLQRMRHTVKSCLPTSEHGEADTASIKRLVMERVVRQGERAVADSFGVLRDGTDLHTGSCRIRHVCRLGRADDRGGREAENRLVKFAVRKVIVALRSLFARSAHAEEELRI